MKKLTHNPFLLLILATFLFQPAYSQDTLRVSLEEAKNYAKIHSNDIRQNAYEIDRANLRVKQALAYLLPQVSGEASYTYYTKVPTNALPGNSFSGSLGSAFGPIIENINTLNGINGLPPYIPVTSDEDILFPLGQKNAFSAKITMFQTLFNGSYLIGFNGAKMYLDLQKSENEVKNVHVMDNVARAYYGTLIAKDNVTLVSKNIANLEKLLFETNEIYKSGFAEELDVDRLRLSLSSLRSQVDGLQAQYMLAETNLKFQMGYPVDSVIVLTDKLETIISSITPLLNTAPDFSARKENKLMQVREDINEIKVKKEKFEYLPVLNAFAAIGSNAQRDQFTEVFQNKWQNYHYVGVQMVVPIWDNFARKRQWQQTEIDIKKIQLGKLQMQEGFKMQYAQAKIDFDNAYRDMQYQQENVALANKIYTVAQKKYKEGVGSSLEMTSAESQYYVAQAQYLGAVYKALIARTNIENALGLQ
jgi:outer membrane protein TolC